MKDVTLIDGTFIPKGTLLAAAAHPTHHDESIYANAEVFEPFRFAKMREGDGEGLKHQFVNTSVDYVSFGHGKHAWYVHRSTSYCAAILSDCRMTARDDSSQRTNSRPLPRTSSSITISSLAATASDRQTCTTPRTLSLLCLARCCLGNARRSLFDSVCGIYSTVFGALG